MADKELTKEELDKAFENSQKQAVEQKKENIKKKAEGSNVVEGSTVPESKADQKARKAAEARDKEAAKEAAKEAEKKAAEENAYYVYADPRSPSSTSYSKDLEDVIVIADPNEAPKGTKVYKQLGNIKPLDVVIPNYKLFGRNTTEKGYIVSDGSKYNKDDPVVSSLDQRHIFRKKAQGKKLSEEENAKLNEDITASAVKRRKEYEAKAKEEKKAEEEKKAIEAEAVKAVSKNDSKAAEEEKKAKEEEKKAEEEKTKSKDTVANFAEAVKAVSKNDSKAAEEKEAAETLKAAEKKLNSGEQLSKDEIKEFSSNLNYFVIQAYVNGAFGKPKSEKAISTMGYYLLDKLGTAVVNASFIARGLQPSQKAAWTDVIKRETELLGEDITSKWWASKSKAEKTALLQTNPDKYGTTATKLFDNTDNEAVDMEKEKRSIEIKTLKLANKKIAQENISALMKRRDELAKLKSSLDDSVTWEAYKNVMEATVGTAKGLSSLGIIKNVDTSSDRKFRAGLKADIKTGKVTKAFADMNIGADTDFAYATSRREGNGSTINTDALALSKYKSSEEFANAARSNKAKLVKELKTYLDSQIEIIDKCIAAWGNDLGVTFRVTTEE